MNTNKKIMFGIVGVVVLMAVFYGGMSYGGNNVRAAINSRGQAFIQNGAMGAGGTRGGRNNGGFTVGQIISKDANSITVQLIAGGTGITSGGGPASPSQGGSKIIFLNTGTTVTKTAPGTIADLVVGTQVSVNGTPNADGSENATSIQIRPSVPTVVR